MDELVSKKHRQKGFLAKLSDYVSVALLLSFVALAAAYFGKMGEQEYQGRFVVMDGDSLEMDGIRFRLEGIDAPEARQICRRGGGDWPCGRESTRYLRNLVAKSNVSCRSLGLDKYDRILAQCYAGSMDINREMVADGWAVSFGGYFGEEARAKAEKRGIWAGEFERPRDWRKTHGDVLDSTSEHGQANGLIAWLRLAWHSVWH